MRGIAAYHYGFVPPLGGTEEDARCPLNRLLVLKLNNP